MSREPSSTSMQASQVLGGWSNAVNPPPIESEAPTSPPRGAQRKRKFRVVVEPAKPKPPVPQPTRGYHDTHRHAAAVSKLVTSTEALTAEEQKIVRGYRISRGGAAAEAVLRQIQDEVRRR